MSVLLKTCQNGTCSLNIILYLCGNNNISAPNVSTNPLSTLCIKLSPKIKQIFILQNHAEYSPIFNQWGNRRLG